jgi:hypothetical protein
MADKLPKPGTVAYVTTTEWSVNCLPEDDPERSNWTITVKYRGRGLWAIKHGAFCLSKAGEWDYEMLPSELTDDWLADHRFDQETAIELARKHAPSITVNGLTPAGLLAWRAQRKN